MAIKLLRANLMYRMGFVMWADNQQTFLSIGKHYTDSFSLYSLDFSLLKLTNLQKYDKVLSGIESLLKLSWLVNWLLSLAWVVTSLMLWPATTYFSGSRRSSFSNCLQCLSCSLMYGNIGCDFIPVTHKMEKKEDLFSADRRRFLPYRDVVAGTLYVWVFSIWCLFLGRASSSWRINGS